MAKQINELHVPVMLERTLEILGESLKSSGAVLVDCTLGLGGHSEAFLRAFPQLHLIAIDRDPQAIALAQERLAPYLDRVDFVNTTYDNIDEAIEELGPSLRRPAAGTTRRGAPRPGSFFHAVGRA